jgi:hypothetical protein
MKNKKKEITILFTGDDFHPYQLQAMLGYPVETLAEKDAIAKSGRYKGNRSPYGMGLVRATGEGPLNVILEKWVDILHSKKEELEALRIQEIEFMCQTKDIEGDEFFISPGTLLWMAELKAQIRILNLD